MTKTPRNEPSASEWKVLRHVWEHGPCTSREVCDALADAEGWADSTIKTLVRRLVGKGHLSARTTSSGARSYTAKRSSKRALFDAGEELLDRARGDAVAPLLAHLVRRSTLTSDDLADLKRLVEDEQRRRKS